MLPLHEGSLDAKTQLLLYLVRIRVEELLCVTQVVLYLLDMPRY